MKRNFNKVLSIMILGYILTNCVSYKNQLFTGTGDITQARENAIIDFVNTYKTPRRYLKERKKNFDVFWIFRKESKDELLVFSISPEIDGHISLSFKDTLGKVPPSYFPNNFKIKEGKLFIWNDNITPLRKDVLEVIDSFGVLDSTDVKRELGQLPDNFEDTRVVTIDHELESVHYFICKRNIEVFKKVVTNKAVGYYYPPKLKCNRKS